MILGRPPASRPPTSTGSAVFYRDLLGFELVLEAVWEAGNTTADTIFGLKDTAVRMVMLRTSNACLELFEFSAPRGLPGDPQRPVCDQGITHICLSVDDITAEHARLSAAGMRFHSLPQDVPGLRRAGYGGDPDGNIVELVEANPAGPFALANFRRN